MGIDMLGSARFNLFRLLDMGTPPISAPSGLTVTSTTTGAINLSWTNGDGTKDIEVYEDGMYYATVAAGSTTYSRTGLSANISKSLKVRHVDGGDSSAFSNTVSGTTKPNAPTGLTAVALGPNSIQLTWTNAHAGLDIHIYVGGVYLTSKAAGSTTHTHSSLSPSTLYEYDIYHYNAGGLSAADSDSATTTAVGPIAEPNTLTAENYAVGQIKLDWVNGDATAVTRIYRGGIQVAELGAGVTTATISGHSAGTAYAFTARHYKDLVETVDSNTANITTLSITSPSVAGNGSADEFIWTWTNNGTMPAGTVGEIEWSDDANNTGGLTINPTDTLTTHTLDVSPFSYDVSPSGATTIRVDYTIRIKSAGGIVLSTVTSHNNIKANVIS